MNLTERLEKIRADRARSQARISDRSGRHRSVSFEQHKLMCATTQQIKLEMKLEKKRTA
jgi:hypothetical protein